MITMLHQSQVRDTQILFDRNHVLHSNDSVTRVIESDYILIDCVFIKVTLLFSLNLEKFCF